MIKLFRLRSVFDVLFLLNTSLAVGQTLENDKFFKPTDNVAAVKQLATFRVPDGFKVELFAAEPQLGSPVAFCLDERGRVFVAEEYRFNRGTEENRTRPFLLDDDLQIKTLDDRLATVKKFADRFEGGEKWFTKHADQVRLLVDTDGDGLADESKVFAGEFNGVLDGMASGVIARDGDVYLTCIPKLWKLRDNDGDGVAEVRQPLLNGFGVNWGFLGHDLHGLCWGPDGKLYFSIGDRGFHVTTADGRTLSGPRSGAVFRCQPDGSDFEVVYRGLRNPQELAFDDFGNLFAADNNCDKGDHSRLVYIVEGGDAGWNMAYQTIPDPYLTGPWHAEKTWHLQNDEQPQHLLPPVGKLGAGPSGFTFTSGFGLPERYRSHFLYCNFTGNGGVEAFAVKPRGAGFEIIDHHDFIKPLMATDVEIGYDGYVYLSDFVGLDWAGPTKGGRIYRMKHVASQAEPNVDRMRQQFATGFKSLSNEDLMNWLWHPDQRARQRAQFELVARGDAVVPLLVSVVDRSAIKRPDRGTISDNDFAGWETSRFARLHAIWALGQIAGPAADFKPAGPRYNKLALPALLPLLSDSDAEVRAQAIRVLGDHRFAPAASKATELLNDPQPRVRMFAAFAIGKLAHRAALPNIVELLKSNADHDRFVRHACVMALLGIGDAEAISQMARAESSSVRMAALLVMRRQADPQLEKFLLDAEPILATEAARAINDLPLEVAQPALARQLDRVTTNPAAVSEAFIRRAINANFRLGGSEHARSIARLAASEKASLLMRQEAVAALADWTNPGPRDRVNGFWRPLAPRDASVIRDVVSQELPSLLASTSGELQTSVVKLVGQLKLPIDDDTFIGWVTDQNRAVSTRSEALKLLAQRKATKLPATLDAALNDRQPQLRAVARHLLADRDIQRTRRLLDEVWSSPSVSVFEKQAAFATLAELTGPATEQRFVSWLKQLAANEVAPELQLDLLDAARRKPTTLTQPLLDQYEQQQSQPENSALLSRFRVSLVGGDAERGRAVFMGHRQGQCVRCHKLNGIGGDAGPDLSKVAMKNPREHLLESLIDPNAKIAQGFGTVTLVLESGRVLGGTIKTEDATAVTLITPEGRTVIVPTKEIEDRTPPKSAMPAMDKNLSPRELRDVVEFLSTLK